MTTRADAVGRPREGVWETLLSGHTVIPVIVADDAACAKPLAQALVEGGIPVAEVTLRTPAAPQLLERLVENSDLLVGAGTVRTVEDVDRAHKAGARFVVSPGLSETIAEKCESLELPYLPGVATSTEVMRALELGLTTLKLFPAKILGGLPFVRALASVFPQVRFVPTGGISGDSAPDYLNEPSVLAVGGSWMVPRKLIRAGAFEEIRGLVAATAQRGVQR